MDNHPACPPSPVVFLWNDHDCFSDRFRFHFPYKLLAAGRSSVVHELDDGVSELDEGCWEAGMSAGVLTERSGFLSFLGTARQ